MRIIGGEWRGRRLKSAPGRDVRPTTDRVREAWMSAAGGRFDGLTVIDLFAGSGGLGLEALSRGAESVVFVEKGRAAVRVLEANIALLSAGDSARVVAGDVFGYLRRESPLVDIALADPPYATGDAAKLVEIFLEAPFAKELWLEHPFRHSMDFPAGSRTRRYGDTALTLLTAPQ